MSFEHDDPILIADDPRLQRIADGDITSRYMIAPHDYARCIVATQSVPTAPVHMIT